MAQKNGWFSKLKSEFQGSPLASNVFFGFILACLEKLVEMEFACPCEPKWNAVFVSAYFIVPAVLVLVLMINIQHADDEESTKERKEQRKRDKWKPENLLSNFVPAIMWLILLFMDGQYFACAMTSWSGRFVSVDNRVPQKWCKPANHTNQASSEYLMMKTQLWFTLSQGIGIVLIFLLTVAFGVRCKWCKKEEQGGNY